MITKEAKEAAIQDIKKDLESAGKTFISYSKYLDPIMEQIEEDYLKKQELC